MTLSVEEALAIAARHFPKGPEQVATQLGVRIERARLGVAAGWCIRGRVHTEIVLNATHPEVRQRFTLAHELAHLLLGMPPDILTTAFGSDATEEREADALASQLLLPRALVSQWHGDSGLTETLINRDCNRWQVSVLTLVRVLASMHAELGYDGVAYRSPSSPRCYRHGTVPANAETLLVTETASTIDAPVPMRVLRCGSPQSMVHLLLVGGPDHLYREQQLRRALFGEDHSWRAQVDGKIGALDPSQLRAQANPEQAFLSIYETHLRQTRGDLSRLERLQSPLGLEYLRLRLSRQKHEVRRR